MASKGIALDRLTRYQEALESYVKALEIGPKFLPALQSIGDDLFHNLAGMKKQ